MRDVVAAAPELEADVRPSQPVRVAIVGLGRMGVAHAAVLSMLPDVHVAGDTGMRKPMPRNRRAAPG